MKGSADVESLEPIGMNFHARQGAWTLARTHARSGPCALFMDPFGRPHRSRPEGCTVGRAAGAAVDGVGSVGWTRSTRTLGGPR